VNRPFGVTTAFDQWLLAWLSPNPALFQTIVAIMKVARDALTRQTLGNEPFQHKAVALRGLRTQLLSRTYNNDTGPVFLTMLFMAILDDELGESAAFNIHRKQLRLMVDAEGGISGCQGAQAVVATTSQFSVGIGPSGTEEDAAHTPPIHYPVHPLPGEFLTMLKRLPLGFQDLASDGLVSFETMRILDRIVRMSDRAEHGNSTESLPVDEVPFTNIRQACPALSIPDGPDGPRMERLLSLALIRYCVNYFSVDRLKMVAYHTVTIELVKGLAKIRLPGTGLLREVFLWQTMTAVDSWSAGHGKLAKEGGLLLDIVNNRFPETRKWDEDLWRHFQLRWGFWTENLNHVLGEYWRGWSRVSVPRRRSG
jgi:hypothetical protein